MNHPNPPVLSCENLSLGYEGQAVLSGLGFSLAAGERLCVAGENGSGKSTLLRGLLGLIPVMEGRVVNGFGPGDTGYLPQESPVQKDFPAAVFEVILSGRQNKKGPGPFYTRTDRAAAEEAMELLDLLPLRRRCFRELSGGQRRRVLLARALCASGKLLLLDEPASGLDPVVQNELYRILEKLNTERGIAILMVSHDIEGALRFIEGNPPAGNILHLAGRQLFFGGPEAYRESEPGRIFLQGGTGRD